MPNRRLSHARDTALSGATLRVAFALFSQAAGGIELRPGLAASEHGEGVALAARRVAHGERGLRTVRKVERLVLRVLAALTGAPGRCAGAAAPRRGRDATIRSDTRLSAASPSAR